MVLSDRTIREELASGRLVIDPFDESLLQPSSVDLRVDGVAPGTRVVAAPPDRLAAGARVEAVKK